MLTGISSNHFGKRLSLLWLFAILNTLYRDIHELTMAHTIEGILAGYFEGNPMSEGVLLFGAFAVELLLLGFLLSALLKPALARLVNLVLAPLAILGMYVFFPNDPDDYFFASVTVMTFAAITVLAWRWKTEEETARTVGGRHAV